MNKIYQSALFTFLVLSLTACSTIKTYRDQGISFDSTRRGVAVTYQDTLFLKASPALTQEGEKFLDNIARMMHDKLTRNALIEIEHEKIGSRALNNELHEVRSLSVMKALVERGINKYRLAFVEVNHKQGIYPLKTRLIFLDEDIRDFQRPQLSTQ